MFLLINKRLINSIHIGGNLIKHYYGCLSICKPLSYLFKSLVLPKTRNFDLLIKIGLKHFWLKWYFIISSFAIKSMFLSTIASVMTNNFLRVLNWIRPASRINLIITTFKEAFSLLVNLGLVSNMAIIYCIHVCN